jgi:hypothetical protein
MRFKRRSTSPLHKKASRGFRGFPVATMIFYGPDNTRATKVAVGIVRVEGAEPEMTRLYSDDGDLRKDMEIGNQILELLNAKGVQSVIIKEGILGCPHEEGIDYPDGKVCPQCPFWARRDRVTGKMIQ